MTTERDMKLDLEHSEPLSALAQAQRQIEASPLVWHALLLPREVAPDGRFVLTGHIVCHDCALCSVAGDFREILRVVPWRAWYPDCTSTEEEVAQYTHCPDEVVGVHPMPLWVQEALYLMVYTTDRHRLTGWGLPEEHLHALDHWGMQLPAMCAGRMPAVYQVIDLFFAAEGLHPSPEALYLPEPEPEPEQAPAQAGACTQQ